MLAIIQFYLHVCCLKRRTYRTEHTNYDFNPLLRIGVKLVHSYTENKTLAAISAFKWHEVSRWPRKLRNQELYCLPPWSKDLIKKLTVPQLVQKIPAFCGTWKFFAVLTTAFQLPLSWARSMQLTPFCPISWRFIFSIILRSKPRPSQPCLSFSFSHQNPGCVSLLCHTCQMPRTHCFPFFVHPNEIWWSTNHEAPHYAITISGLLLPPT